MKTHLISLAIYTAAFVLLGAINAVHAEDATTRTPNWCKGRAESDCTAAVACKYVPQVIWSGDNGKTRISKAHCAYDAKAGKAYLASQFASQN